MVDFYEQATTPACHQALDYLRQQPFIGDFYLAGGTALAIQIGHRVSTDLDWFSINRHLLTPERETIRQALSSSGQFVVASEQDGMMFTQLLGADVSFIYQHHPLLEPTVEYQGIQLASPTDIGLMKLAAINSRGTRRDFVDLYSLRDIVTLDRLLELATVKYEDRPSFLHVAARALAYFEDAEPQPMPRLLTPVEWADVRAYCEAAARRLTRRLSGLEG
ncbi:MAG: nucleotidyl transferase AbiEii/AbiGii toxin family protein [Chloroflexota bacterium]|nr:nucleotidyl transferase AbiEii/AbiGii toxin family protein [Chloroflexota bacterium]